MRTQNADGSITEDCQKCHGSKFVEGKTCEACNGEGQSVIAPAGSVVTDESPDLRVSEISFGGGSPAPIAVKKGDPIEIGSETFTVENVDIENATITLDRPVLPAIVADEVLDVTTANATEGETPEVVPDPAPVKGKKAAK